MILFTMELDSHLAQEAEQLKQDPAGVTGAARLAIRMSLRKMMACVSDSTALCHMWTF